MTLPEPDNKYLQTAKEALLPISHRFEWEKKADAADLALQMAWRNLLRYVRFETRPETSYREKEEFKALLTHAVEMTIELSNTHLRIAEDMLRKAHENERYFPSVLQYLTKKLDLKLNSDSICGDSIQHEDHGGDSSLVEELRTMGGKSDYVSDGFNMVSPVSSPKSAIERFFEGNMTHYGNAEKHLTKALRMFHSGRDNNASYNTIKELAGVLDGKGGTTGADLLKKIRLHIFEVADEIQGHIGTMEKSSQYYDWMMGSESLVHTPYKSLEGARHHSEVHFPIISFKKLVTGFSDPSPENLLSEAIKETGITDDDLAKSSDAVKREFLENYAGKIGPIGTYVNCFDLEAAFAEYQESKRQQGRTNQR